MSIETFIMSWQYTVHGKCLEEKTSTVRGENGCLQAFMVAYLYTHIANG